MDQVASLSRQNFSNAKEFANSFLDREISNYLPIAYQFIDEHENEWKLDYDADLEVTNHVLRVRIQDLSIDKYKNDILDICKCQNKDGGWGNTKNDQESKIRSTAFCVQMLLRANRILHVQTVQTSILSGLDYIISAQKSNGSWDDPTWHFLDAASTSVGTLLFVLKENFIEEKHRQALDQGMKFILSNRHDNGLWYYKLTGSPVTITAHLLQKCATYYGHAKEHDLAIRELIKLQHHIGHWDNGNTDHTCDAIRAMMLTSSRSKNKDVVTEVFHSACKAVQWLIEISKNIGGGLGDRPGKPAHVERTCDGIDAMLKLRQFALDNTQMINFWS